MLALRQVHTNRNHELLIAAVAKAYDVTLVTHNVGEFSRVHGLLLEDWQAE